jgi:threonine dehydratase
VTTIEDIKAAAQAIAGEIIATPMLCSKTLSDIIGAEVWLKFETLQFTASFKERGALFKLKSLSQAERARGVIAMSAGNHAQAVAYHAQRLKIPATIVMPETTPFVKVKHTENFGAKVVLAGDTLSDAEAMALKLARAQELVFVHPYDDEIIIAGQGTVALEMCAAAPALDTLMVPIGGGGLISGCAIAAHALDPTIEIYGVEAALFPAIHNVIFNHSAPCGGDTIAEGIAVKKPGVLTVPIIRAHVADILLASEPQIEHAIACLLTIEKAVAEGAGAAALGALMAHAPRFRGRKVGVVLSGGNIEPRLLANVILRELAREGRILTIRIGAQDRPGNLARFTTIIGEAGGNIIDITHNRLLTALPAKDADIGFTIETRDRAHGEEIVRRLEAAGANLREIRIQEETPPERYHASGRRGIP